MKEKTSRRKSGSRAFVDLSALYRTGHDAAVSGTDQRGTRARAKRTRRQVRANEAAAVREAIGGWRWI
jgi:hypothetical protein